MGVYSDQVRRLYDFGLITIPCKDKRPVLGKEWEKFCNEQPNEELVDKWEKQYKDINQLGLTLGTANGMVAFDFDYEYNEKRCTVSEEVFNKDRKNVEKQIIAILPPTPCIKVGRKGWTRIYRAHGPIENAQSERNGVRLFDFLARNKQTIIPPSIYAEDSDLKYRWIGPHIEDCLDDIPIITQNVINEIRFILGEVAVDESRHGKLLRWIIRQSIIEKDQALLIKSAIEHDKIVNNPPYLIDKKHFKTDNAETNCTEWIKRIMKWKSTKPKGTSDNETIAAIKQSREMYFQFFASKLGRHKVDLMSDRLMVEVETKTEYGTSSKRWRPADNMIKEIRSDARNIGLKHDPIEDHLAAYRKSLTPGLLLEIPEWDGVDRIEKICALVPARNLVPALSEKNDQGMDYELGAKLYVEIVKDIGAGIFRRAFNSMEQNLFTIFRGPQGVGKNYFIEKLFCSPFQHYAAEVNVGTDQAKNYDAVEGRLVCVIGEFDQTQKVQVSFIKELITNASFTARRAYERTSDRYDLRQTFFSASNFQHVLKDTSGNRRFVIFDVPHINWEYNEHCDSQQLLAQYFQLYKEEFRMSAEARDWIKAFNKGETPEDPMELAVESYLDRMQSSHRMTVDEWLTNAQVEEQIADACKMYQIPLQRFRQELNRRKLTKRSNGIKYLNTARLKTEGNVVHLGRQVELENSW